MATPVVEGSATQAGNAQDYESRLRNEHDFAVKMAKQHQARADQAESENKPYRSFRQKVGDKLAGIVEHFGDGEKAVTFLEEYNAMLANPAFQQAVNTYRTTGKVEMPTGGQAANGAGNGAADAGDEYLTTEEKEIRGLKAELNEMKNLVGSMNLNSGRSSLQSQVDKLLENYLFEPAEVEKVKGHVSRAIEQFHHAGNTKALQDLQGPNSYMMVRSLALASLEDSSIQKAAERARLRKSGQLGRLATDGPLANSGRGEPPPKFKSGKEALQWAKENPDAHDSY